MNAQKIKKYFRQRRHDKFSFEVGASVNSFMESMNKEGFWNAHCMGMEWDNLKQYLSEDNINFLEALKKEPPAFGIFLDTLCRTIEAELKTKG